jgi:hypothetical protein
MRSLKHLQINNLEFGGWHLPNPQTDPPQTKEDVCKEYLQEILSRLGVKKVALTH